MTEKTTSIADAPLSVGTIFADRYRVERVIAHGERKWTYLASDMKARGRRQVALAVMDRGAASSGSQREVEMMGKVGGHDSIVTLHDFDLEAPKPYLVFEYLPGGRLRDHCRDLQARGSQTPFSDFFRTSRQLCRALAHIHERGVIHRDVAATNVLLDERGVAHLGDFDTAISTEEAAAGVRVPLTSEGLAAPELRGGDIPDHRADLYSLGAVLYELLVGTLPWAGELPSQAPPPSRFRPSIPRSLDKLIMSLLAADRDKRPQSATVVLDELREAEKTADLESLIAGAETATLEFKQTMRWDTLLHKRNPKVLRACMKTVSAFLNCAGGTLLIGVADSGEPVGLDDDLRDFTDGKTLDGFERRFRDALSLQVDPEPNQRVTLSFPFVNGIQICRVDVTHSPRPAFLVAKDGPAEFYVRKGNASHPVTNIRQACQYVRDHWQ